MVSSFVGIPALGVIPLANIVGQVQDVLKKFDDAFSALQGIFGGDGNSDTHFGGDGHDVAFGVSGHDVLKGGKENDLLVGGYGNDTFEVEPDEPVQPDDLIDDIAFVDLVTTFSSAETVATTILLRR